MLFSVFFHVSFASKRHRQSQPNDFNALPNARGCMAMRCHNQWSDFCKILWNRWGTVISRITWKNIFKKKNSPKLYETIHNFCFSQWKLAIDTAAFLIYLTSEWNQNLTCAKLLELLNFAKTRINSDIDTYSNLQVQYHELLNEQ